MFHKLKIKKMAKSKKVAKVIEEEVESTVILNLPKEEPQYPGSGSRDFNKGKAVFEEEAEGTTEE